MTIDVFRIYLGFTWADAAAVERLTRGLDGVPGLLYRFDRPAVVSPESFADPEEAQSLMRIAMTQSHVCLVWADGARQKPGYLAIELDLARHTFRRRIPVVVIGERDHPADAAIAADATVTWCPTSIATTVQQVAEAAAAERRVLYRHVTAKGAFRSVPEATSPAGGGRNTDGPREHLPIAEITRAYEEFCARRSSRERDQA